MIGFSISFIQDALPVILITRGLGSDWSNVTDMLVSRSEGQSPRYGKLHA